MADILFVGDSLTAGNLGISYLQFLREVPELRDHTIINQGTDGYTLEGIRLKMESWFKEKAPPKVLIIEGGANDLLLPYMQSRGKEWDPFIRKLLRSGSIPAESARTFEATLDRTLSSAFDYGIQQVMTCTIPCLGENLSSPLNKMREDYNSIIRAKTGEFWKGLYNCSCADLAASFEEVLKPFQPGSDYLFTCPRNLQLDSQRLEGEGEKFMCSERNLHLTIDGAHLNLNGAQIVSEMIMKTLQEKEL